MGFTPKGFRGPAVSLEEPGCSLGTGCIIGNSAVPWCHLLGCSVRTGVHLLEKWDNDKGPSLGIGVEDPQQPGQWCECGARLKDTEGPLQAGIGWLVTTGSPFALQDPEGETEGPPRQRRPSHPYLSDKDIALKEELDPPLSP
ncbi:hypothetical protein E5288_WYG004765 [Bos mutus]|uniref:Uncharacterized protein n=1 Tax=Bos mutus TaxID=72004 RepID=A0A6B0R2P0_9CETA|nr:hypothetical protein [Bos mutus]